VVLKLMRDDSMTDPYLLFGQSLLLSSQVLFLSRHQVLLLLFSPF
jgi:hypothetical protein